MKSTLDKEVKLTGIRADGNTTRQIDYAVQCLLSGDEVEIIDHANDSYEQTETMCKRILNRIHKEHLHPRRSGRHGYLKNLKGRVYKLEVLHSGLIINGL